MKNNDHVLDILEFTFPEVLKYILLLRVWEFERERVSEREREGGGMNVVWSREYNFQNMLHCNGLPGLQY